MEPRTIQDLSCTGRHQECLQACQQLLQSEPENPFPWKYSGKSLLALGQFEKAQQCLTKAHQLDTNDPETAKDIGNTFLRLGNTSDAAKWYKKSFKISNNYAPSINNLASIERQIGNNQEAADLFKKAIQLDPQLTQAYLGAAASLLALGDLDQAEAIATQAIKINAYAPGINEILGITFQNKKNSQQAIESYQNELAINPQSNTSLLNLGLLLLQQGKAAAAIEPLARAAAINPSEQCSLLLAQAYQNIGKSKEAISEYQKIDLNKTQNRIIPFNLGLCLLNTGSNIEAIEAFKLAIKMDESFLPAWGNIGTALMNEGRHNEALPATQKVLELKPDDPTAHMNLGGIYKELGQLDHALASTLKSLDLKPDNPTALINLGGIYKELGQLDHALASNLKSLELKPDNPDAHINLGQIYKDLGNLDQALSCTLKSLELKPDNPTAHMNLGIIYKDLERIEEAKTAFSQALRTTTKDTKALTAILDFYDSINEEELLKQAIIYLKSALPSESMRITMFEARELFRQKKYEESWAKLPAPNSIEKHFKDWESILRYHEFRAKIAEKNNNYDAAYNSFKASNINPLYRVINHKKAHDRIHEYISLSKKISKDESRTYPRKQIHDAAHPVFLIGFPRSGTTLLDTILRSHPDVDVVEEKDPLSLTESFGIKNLQRQISNFNSLNEDNLNKMRDLYIEKLKSHSEGDGKLIIDKLPLHTVAIPLINLLFPNAKIIFALRHPCDTILSCFQQTFEPNISMANFTDLEKSVDFYDEVMNGWVAYNENLEIDYAISKYEDLVNTFDESVLKVLKHLNLPWNDGVMNYRSTAMNRASINTPSSSQVVQPLYKSSIGRWINYQQHFTKYMNKLNLWINYFGYNA